MSLFDNTLLFCAINIDSSHFSLLPSLNKFNADEATTIDLTKCLHTRKSLIYLSGLWESKISYTIQSCTIQELFQISVSEYGKLTAIRKCRQFRYNISGPYPPVTICFLLNCRYDKHFLEQGVKRARYVYRKWGHFRTAVPPLDGMFCCMTTRIEITKCKKSAFRKLE